MIDFFTRLVALVRKELLTVLNDKKSRASLIGPPIMQLLIFGYAATMDVTYVPYALYDEDRSALSREITAQLEGCGIFHRVAEVNSPEELNQLMDNRKITIGVSFLSDFSRKALSPEGGAGLQVIADARNSSTAGVALSYVSQIAMDRNISLLKKQVSEEGVPSVVEIENRAWYNPNLYTRVQVVPGLLATLSLIETMLLASLSLAREREEGTLDQLLVAPFARWEILLGKALATCLIVGTQATMILLLTLYWFKIPLVGSLPLLIFGVGLFICTATAIGMAISAFTRSLQQAIVGTFLSVVPLIMLSGFATPVASMPLFFQDLTLLNPMRYAIEIVRRVFLEDASFGELLPQFSFIMGLFVVACGIAWGAFATRRD